MQLQAAAIRSDARWRSLHLQIYQCARGLDRVGILSMVLDPPPERLIERLSALVTLPKDAKQEVVALASASAATAPAAPISVTAGGGAGGWPAALNGRRSWAGAVAIRSSGAGFPVCSLGSALESKGRGETHGLHELTRGPYSRAMATFVRFVALPITARFFPDRDEALPEALQQRRQRRQFIR
jgi:hypothetical protein